MATQPARVSMLLLFLLFGVDIGILAQSNQGTYGREFIFSILQTYTTKTDFSIIISSGFFGHATISIPHLSIHTRPLAFNTYMVYNVTKSMVTTNAGTVDTTQKSVRITTDCDVTVTVVTYPSDENEGFLVLPISMLSTRYVIASYPSDDSSYDSEFLLLANDNTTDVNIQIPGSTPINVTLDSMNTYLYKTQRDLSGTVIQSNKPLAVFSGNQATSVPVDCGYRTYLVEQLVPTKYFAKEFVVPPVSPKSGFVTRIFSSEPDTRINFGNSSSSGSQTITKPGMFYEVLSLTEPLYITADKPVQVVLYGTCRLFQSDNNGNGIMINVPSVRQYRSNYHLNVYQGFDHMSNYLAVVSKAENSSEIKLDGTSPSPLFMYNVSVGNNVYIVNIYAVNPGYHVLENKAGGVFGAFLYGYEDRTAYGYMLGMVMATLDCGSLPPPSHGGIQTPGTTEGSQVTYFCLGGYVLDGDQKRTCMSDGHWSGQQPNCQPANTSKNCGPLPPPGHGGISTPGTTEGSQVTYSCFDGYVLDGDQRRTCMSDGHWSGQQPNCRLANTSKNCGPLPPPGHGGISTPGTTEGSQVTYSCFDPYVLDGDQKRTCMSDGHWSGQQPNCRLANTSKNCGPLPPPGHGGISTPGTTEGSQVTYSCFDPYVLDGDQKRTCMSDGHWSGQQPNCRLANTGTGGSVTCLNCKDMSNLYLCDTIETCAKGQECYVETLTTNDGHVKYSSGCIEPQSCSQKQEASKRSSECVHCCSTKLCNMNGCGSQSLPPAEQRGPLCYDCAYFASLDECKTMKLCAKDEVCSLEKYDWGGLYDHYTAKCHSNQCISHKRSNDAVSSDLALRSTPVCQSCCGTDLCNVGCNVTSHGSPGTAIVG